MARWLVSLASAALLLGCGAPAPPPVVDPPAPAPIAPSVLAASAIPAVPVGSLREPPTFAGDVLTDTRDVRACLPLAGGAVLAGTGGGLVLIRADGTARAAWTSLDGLPETRVHALLLDGDRLWIGTEAGLAEAHLRGDELTVDRTISSSPIRALALHDGELFAATWGLGLARLDPKGGRLVRVGPPGERLSSLAVFEGSLHAGGVTGLSRLTGITLQPIPGAPGSIWFLAVAGDRLWIGSLGGLVSLARGALRGESSADVRALASSGAQPAALFGGTFGQGAVDLGGPSALPIAALSARAPFVQAVGIAGPTRCVGAPTGLFVQRGAGGSWDEARLPELASNDVSALAPDGGRLWIGTFDRGLSLLENRRVARVTDAAIDDKINAIAVERGPTRSVWVATARGLDRLEPGPTGFRVTRYGEADGLPSNDVHAVVALQGGGALVGTGRGAALVRDGRVTPLAEKRGIPPGAVWAVAEGPRGSILLGTSRGLLIGTLESRGVVVRGSPARADADAGAPDPWLQLSMATGDLDDDWITALAVRGATIYVGTYNAGVTVLTPDSSGALSAAQLGGGYVNMGGLTLHGATLYAATMTGLLARRVDGIGTPAPWRSVPRAAPGKDVTAVTALEGRLWVASRRGLSLSTRL